MSESPLHWSVSSARVLLDQWSPSPAVNPTAKAIRRQVQAITGEHWQAARSEAVMKVVHKTCAACWVQVLSWVSIVQEMGAGLRTMDKGSTRP